MRLVLLLILNGISLISLIYDQESFPMQKNCMCYLKEKIHDWFPILKKISGTSFQIYLLYLLLISTFTLIWHLVHVIPRNSTTADVSWQIWIKHCSTTQFPVTCWKNFRWQTSHIVYDLRTQKLKFVVYRILPIKGASPNKGAPHSLGKANFIINFKNTHSFFNNCPIFNPKPPFESSEPQLSAHNIGCDLANAPGALIRQNTVHARTNWDHKNAFPWRVRSPILKSATTKVGRTGPNWRYSILIVKNFQPTFRLANFNMALLSPKINALWWSLIVLGWVQSGIK